MSANKQIIRAAAVNGVNTHVRWAINDSGHFISEGVNSAIFATCAFLREHKKEFNYGEVLDAIYDIICEREQKVRMRISGILP